MTYAWPARVDPKTYAFYTRLNTIRDALVAKIPTTFDRGPFYFSTSGDDTTGDGSEGNPWQTVAKAQTEINAAEAATETIAVLFKRGDHWKGLTAGLDLAGDRCYVGAYGTGDNPIFSTASQVTGWTDAGGGVYSKVMTEPEWLYVSGVFSSALEFAGTTTTPTAGQWSYNTGTAYIHLADSSDPGSTIDAIPFVNDDGISLDSGSDECACEDIDFVGFGIDRSSPVTQVQGCTIDCDGTNVGIIRRCGSYYCGHHGMQVLGNSGGVQLFEDCEADWFVNDSSSGSTMYNSYKLNGGQYTMFHRCDISHGGNLRGVNDTTQTCTGFFSHTGSGTIGELLIWDCEIAAELTGRITRFAFVGGTDATYALDDTGTAFCIDCIWGKTTETVTNARRQVPPSKVPWINGEWHVYPKTNGTTDAWFVNTEGAYLAINTIGTIEYHAGFTRGNQGWYNFSAKPASVMVNDINGIIYVIKGGSATVWFWNRDAITDTNDFGEPCGARGTIYWASGFTTARHGWHDSVGSGGEDIADNAFRGITAGANELNTTTHVRLKSLSSDPVIATIKARGHTLADFSDNGGMAPIVEYDAGWMLRGLTKTSVGPYRASDEESGTPPSGGGGFTPGIAQRVHMIRRRK